MRQTPNGGPRRRDRRTGAGSTDDRAELDATVSHGCGDGHEGAAKPGVPRVPIAGRGHRRRPTASGCFGLERAEWSGRKREAKWWDLEARRALRMSIAGSVRAYAEEHDQ